MQTFLVFVGGIIAGYLFGITLTDRTQLNSIINKLNEIMANSQERFDLLMGRLDTVTSDIAADYAQLLAEIQKGGVSDESFAKHEANIAVLETLGASVSNPVPEPPTEPPVEG